MRRLLLFSVTLLLSLLSAKSIPAYNKPIRLPSGITIQLRGDESCKWAMSEDGYTILPTDSGWVYAQSMDGWAVPSPYRLVASANMHKELKAFLAEQPKKLQVKREPVADAAWQFGPQCDVHAISPIIGERKALVIMMAFQDVSFTKSKSDFDALFNEEQYCADGAIGSVKDFFLWSSYGKLNFTCDVIGPFTAEHNMSYYGGNTGPNQQDKNPFELFEEAIQRAARVVNLKDYDSDGDGFIDNVHIVFAGYGEEAGASASAIWSHEMTFIPMSVQGVMIGKYSCAPELRGNRGNGISRIGPHCHEMGHALGAMDFYDVDYEKNGYFEGTGKWDIMASGSWNNDGICPPDFNPYVKLYNFGWAKEQHLPANTQVSMLPAAHCDDQIFRIDTPIPNEYYLLENRQQEMFDSALPGHGLLVFHVGTRIEAMAQVNQINAKFPQQCYVVCASSQYAIPSSSPSSYGQTNSDGCPFPGSSGKNVFSDTTIPSAYCNGGSESGIMLSNIRESANGTLLLYNGTPQPDEQLWFEGFESDVISDNWHQDDNAWKIYTVSSSLKNPSSDMPVPMQGNKYLYTKRGNLSFGNSGTTACEIVSAPVNIQDIENAKIKLCYYNQITMGTSVSQNNRLCIHVEYDNERHLLGTLGLTGKVWKTVEYDLDICGSKEFRIVLVGEGSDIGYICIDDIKIMGKPVDTSVAKIEKRCLSFVSMVSGGIVVNSPQDDVVNIYNMSGHILLSRHVLAETPTHIHLPKGIYMVSVERGWTKPVKVAVTR